VGALRPVSCGRVCCTLGLLVVVVVRGSGWAVVRRGASWCVVVVVVGQAAWGVVRWGPSVRVYNIYIYILPREQTIPQ
jgi:hypothetical protein